MSHPTPDHPDPPRAGQSRRLADARDASVPRPVVARADAHADAAPPRPAVDPEALQASAIRALRGPNYWRLAPVIACDVRLGALEQVTSADVPGFTEALVTAMPTLHEHPCSRGATGGFVERLREGTHLPHVLEHLALELQALAGSDVRFGRVVPSGDEGVWWVIVAYEHEEVGLQAMRDAVRVVRAALAGTPADALAADVRETVGRLHARAERVRLGPSTSAVVEEARRRGIPVRRLNSGSLVQLGLGRHLRRIQATMTDLTSAIAVELAQDKDDTKRVLGNIGLPVPQGGVARDEDEAVEIAASVGYPVLLKPLDASHGDGISPRLDDADGVRRAWAAAVGAARGGRHVLVERFATGRDHRVLVVGGRMVACAERVPAHVVGDGARTVRALIAEANADPRRGQGHDKILTRLPEDDTTVAFLARGARTLDTVPAAGETVFLRATANLSTGGTSIDRTDEMHPDNVTACEMAAGAVGLDVAGIDVLTDDVSVPFRENGAVIIEVNASPGIRMHTHPAEGKPRNVAAPIVDLLYPPGTETEIPVLAVTGTNGKTTTVRLIAHLFRHTGKTVGFTTTDGVYLQNRLVMEGDMTGPFAANIILSNPTVDVAVLETARGGLLRAGLGWEECDVGVVLNVTADHLGLRGIHTLEQLAEVKSVIPAVVRREGHAVLNADDPLVAAMRERTGGDVVLLSVAPAGTNPVVEEHLARGGIVARVEYAADDAAAGDARAAAYGGAPGVASASGETFVLRKGRLRIPIAAVDEVPLLLGGAARFQRVNVLAAIAAAYVQGMRYDDIRAGLLSFFPSPALTPGRLNVLRLSRGAAAGARVLVDYAHNPAAVAGLVDMVTRMPAARRLAVVTAPGDRRDEDLREVGRLCASFDAVILKEDDDRRGREPGAIAALLREGLRAGGLADAAVEEIDDEGAAVDGLLARLQAGDLGVVLADDVRGVLDRVRRAGAIG
ncbi:cyanophycin synthetase [Roseisolibacter sp. H3M3-2]|uniref:cyanophycin synthetase n=1 Tax=Roseisolibacter sp. H3M3-2 TaxID=3031323 RepID=UPI0023DB3606|nr:cyanophycin synthetase [Roseisolibacter sp. H3M3-2]MDF1505489.1 cyanophycin synthetase [Roseisolibacter sp. H3M3-2]